METKTKHSQSTTPRTMRALDEFWSLYGRSYDTLINSSMLAPLVDHARSLEIELNNTHAELQRLRALQGAALRCECIHCKTRQHLAQQP